MELLGTKILFRRKRYPTQIWRQKMYNDIRLPLEEEIDTLEVYELTSPEPFKLEQETVNSFNVLYQM